MVKVEKCCFCIKLSNFAIVLGSFGAFMSLTLVMLVGGFLLNYDGLAVSFHQKGTFESVQLATFLEKWKNIVITILVTYVSLQMLSFIGSLSLVCGTIHKRPKLLIGWLVIQSFLLMFWIFASIATNDVYLLLYSITSLYFWVCIYSLYQSLNLQRYGNRDGFFGIGHV